MFKSVTVLAVALAGIASTASLANAQDYRKHGVRVVAARPLTVTKRSWLDSGNVVAVGTGNSYLSQSTTLNQPIYSSYAPARFGQSTLPGQFDLAFSNENPRGSQSGGIFFDSDQ